MLSLNFVRVEAQGGVVGGRSRKPFLQPNLTYEADSLSSVTTGLNLVTVRTLQVWMLIRS